MIGDDEQSYSDWKDVDFSTLYDHFSPRLYTHALRMLNDREEATDVVQDVFTKLWSKRSEIQISGSLKAYLYTATRNQVLDKLASRQVASKYQKFTADTLAGSFQELYDESAREQQLMKIIDSEVQQMPSQMQRIFEMSRWQQKSYNQIAEDLQVSPLTVKTQIARALKKLKRLALG